MKSTQNYKLFYNKTELNVFKQSPFIGNLVLKGYYSNCNFSTKGQGFFHGNLKTAKQP